ncbi:phosphonate C-P lyase system protein PhnG [Antarctobacter heliothermus]|uniref:Alpha-D-ribose 1-methylphosphonate 5-triphosphate synthase subunit PhnG n=1 Tax=Antarctobacter heliothermus TaxID=74033 RepID=A0A239KPH6_9RHOB|nr:phosphonate C-P lyase system protein PhnG [Antarctobacter heliothermus]SNT19632.1 alpha-D-ribose 1-methylphosphonate 5-triphosphate synthase subunit PhnG [Antarctobacter heliothermus]
MTDDPARKEWMGLLAKAKPDALEGLWTRQRAPRFTWLRAPEIGAAMVRGRIGGTGAPFNLGEMTVTRCSLQLDDGTVGHGYVQGRNKPHAERAALIDALMQTGAAEGIEADVLSPLRAQALARGKQRASKAAATKVEFFTLVRGED